MSACFEITKEPSSAPAQKYVSHTKGKRLMRQMVRILEARFGNPPRAKLYSISK